MPIPSEIDRTFLDRQSALLAQSFERLVGRQLIDVPSTSPNFAERLFDAPIIVVSHGIQDDPILNYGNASALRLWEMTWSELTSTPSRLTAEPANQLDRAEAMDRVKHIGFTEGYSAVRISKSGKRFRIEDTVIWNVVSADNTYQGQAATFANWTFL